MISGERILITGVTGIIGQAVARSLAGDNVVWGLARFAGRDSEASDAMVAPSERHMSTRGGLDALGITTRPLDVAAGDFDDLPDDFTSVIHLAWRRAELSELDVALRTNVEGPGVLLQHCRNAKVVPT